MAKRGRPKGSKNGIHKNKPNSLTLRRKKSNGLNSLSIKRIKNA